MFNKRFVLNCAVFTALASSCNASFAQESPEPSTSTQNSSMQLGDLLSQNAIPVSLKLNQLNSSWWKFTSQGNDSLSQYPWMSYYSEMMGSSPTYYTKGQIFSIGEEKYMAAYRVQLPKIDWQQMMRSIPTETPKMPRLTASTPVVLSLLNLRTTGNFTDLQAFNLQQELSENNKKTKAFESAQSKTANELAKYGSETASTTVVYDEKKIRTQSLNNLKQIGTAVTRYAKAHDNKLPSLRDTTTAMKALKPYVKNQSVFQQPDGNGLYHANRVYSGKSVRQISQPQNAILFYETEPCSSGTVAVVFANGRAKRLSDSEWNRLKRFSKIP